MDKIKQIEQMVKRACDKSKYFPLRKFQWQHMQFVRKHAIELAKRLKADVKVVEVAALLHDIGRVKIGPENHEITSAAEAEKILKNLNFNSKFIEKVKRAVLTHRGKSKFKPIKLEEKIVACADAMAHFDVIPTLFYVAIKEMGMTPEEAKVWISQKLDRAWIKISRIPEAQKLLQKKHEAIKLIFGK